jgi:hypothetical protein
MSNELLSLFLRFYRFMHQATHLVAASGETLMKAFFRLAVTTAVLGAAVPAMLVTVGCNNPAADALSSALKPLTSKYTVGGSVSGLSGSDLVLEDNGGDDLAVTANGTFTFATTLALGANYTVTVKTQPGNPAQTCSVTNASGTVASANITSVSVRCTNNPTAATTAVGTALASPLSSKVIDATGGAITSADGRMTVTVPAGAVAAATTFTIQAITNQAPGGVGDAYRLGPEGENFSTPVSVTLHFSSADLAGTVADLLSLAYQDSQGRWGVYKSVTVDATNETLTVSSSHFSDWALVAGESLEPAAARIGTGQTQTLTLMWCAEVDFGDQLIQYAAVCQPISDANSWSANGVPGGNSAVGTVASVGQAAATYTAPGKIPAANPVAVSVDALVTPLGKNQTQELFVSNITIGGCSATNAQECTWTGTSSAANSHWKATAQVTWKWQSNDPSDPSIVTYVPASGSVTLTDLQPNCRVDGAPQPITSAAPSRLTINYNMTPPAVDGNGTNLTGWTESCTPPENPPAKPGAVWWADAGSTVSADGLKIEGNTNMGGLSSSWSFTAN